jgi:HSP20 family protein
MSTTRQPPQSVPLQMHQTDDRIVLAAPMPGLEPQDISVVVSGHKVTIHGEYRGSREGKPDLLVSEWTAGPYHREVELPQLVDGGLTNASYGNGVLMLSMPKVGEGKGEDRTQFQLEVVDATRGLRVGHTGSDIQPSTTQEHQRKVAEARDDRS